MADVEVALLDFFADVAYTTTVADYRYLQEQITDHGGVLRIRRIGGGADRDADHPTVSIQCYANETQDNPRAAHDLDAAVWGRFLEVLNGSNSGWVGGVILEDPSRTSGPVELPGPETTPQITVVESLYQITLRN